MPRVLLFGTFDFLHIGHIHAMQEARRLGNELIIVVGRDAAVQKLKKRKPIHTEQERKAMVEALSIPECVVLGDTVLGAYRVIGKYKPNIIAIGYDQDALAKDLARFLKQKKNPPKLVRLRAYKPHARASRRFKQAFSL